MRRDTLDNPVRAFWWLERLAGHAKRIGCNRCAIGRYRYVPGSQWGWWTSPGLAVRRENSMGTLLIFAGGITIARAFSSSGLGDLVGTSVSALGALPLPILLVVLCLCITFLTELTSNTATAALLMPVARKRRDSRKSGPACLDVASSDNRQLRVHAAGCHPAQRRRLRIGESFRSANGTRGAGAQSGWSCRYIALFCFRAIRNK